MTRNCVSSCVSVYATFRKLDRFASSTKGYKFPVRHFLFCITHSDLDKEMNLLIACLVRSPAWWYTSSYIMTSIHVVIGSVLPTDTNDQNMKSIRSTSISPKECGSSPNDKTSYMLNIGLL